MMSQDAVAQPGLAEHDLIVLAGGGGTRLGGLDKAGLVVAGRPLLERVLQGAGLARQVVVVAPPGVVVPDGVLRTMEDPPGGGPVAGIAAGLTALARSTSSAHSTSSAWTVVIAVDQPAAGQAIPALVQAAANADPGVDILCPHDDQGHAQWLLAAYRTTSLTQALGPLGTGHNISVRRMVQDLVIADVPTPHQGDIDTWADHKTWEQRLGARDGASF